MFGEVSLRPCVKEDVFLGRGVVDLRLDIIECEKVSFLGGFLALAVDEPITTDHIPHADYYNLQHLDDTVIKDH